MPWMENVLIIKTLSLTMGKVYKGFARVYKWGGSYVVKIRPETRKALGIERDDYVEITLQRSSPHQEQNDMSLEESADR